MSTPGAAVPELSLVFPAWNERRNLERLLDAALGLGTALGRRIEVVVVDDGSRDATAALLDAWRERHPELRVVTHPENRGYGAALRSGLRAARGELVFFSDADLQFELSELKRLLAEAEQPGGCDVVAGYRAPRRDPPGRRVLAWGWGRMVRALFDCPVRDIDCAFKLFRRPVIEAIPIASIGAFVNTEILVRARSTGFRIGEVPVSHRPRTAGRQSGARPRVIARALVELAALYRELRAPAVAPAPAPGRPDG